ncbi:hypothetical protein F511_18931 [Dorcoceras hygrometricum]|uniref:Uncharacterized protein n=1 Tax=Dorcoceras hygrometricum TaxID=472368 RepID=A0A2Z7DAP1_9LAMI|nr:hypothetical protein F511_18931 [Dorcoceras hygrometricum]
MNSLKESIKRTQYSVQLDLMQDIRDNKKQLGDEVATLSFQIAEVLGGIKGHDAKKGEVVK